MALSFVDVLFLASFFLPPAAVVLGALSLVLPARRRQPMVRSAAQAH